MDWVVSIVGLTGFWLAGRKVWWCWYVNLGAQVLWVVFALGVHQYGLLVGTAGYTFVFAKNAYGWTRNRHIELAADQIDAFEASIESVDGKHKADVVDYGYICTRSAMP